MIENKTKYNLKSNLSLPERLVKMPKIELHVHLEGAMNAKTIYEMAERNNTAYPAESLKEWEKFYKFSNFNHFIEVYKAASKCIITPEDYMFMIDKFMEMQARQNIIYSEVFISASLHINEFSDEEWIEAIAEGMRLGEKKYATKIAIIPDIAREYPDTQERVLELIIKGQKKGVFIGLGLGGLESGFPPELFIETYAKARRNNLHVVAHAGEAAGPTSVWGAIQELKIERIGHGIRCMEDDKLVKFLQEHQIPLEVCPVSNYCTGILQKREMHPLHHMMEAGLYCTVNSDDPSMFSSSLNNEYKMLASQGFTWEELWQLNKNALEASFLSNEEKANYRKQLVNFENQAL